VHQQGPAPLDAAAAELLDAEFFDGDGEGAGAEKPLARVVAGGGAPSEPHAVKNPLAGEGGGAGGAAPAVLAVAAPAAADDGAAGSVASWGVAAAAAAPARPPPPPPSPPLSERLRAALLAAFASVPLASPPLDGSAGPLRTRAAKLINTPLLTLLFDGAIVINTAVELYRLSTEVEGAPRSAGVEALINAQRAMLAVFTVEFSLKLAVFGLLAYLRCGWGHKLDAAILAASLGAGFAEAAGRFDATLNLLIQMLRALRLGRYAQKLRLGIARRTGVTILPGFGPTVSAGVDTLPLLARWLVLLAAALYAFAAAGGEAFAGRLSAAPGSAAMRSAWGASLPPRLSFDSFGRAGLAAYALLLNNTWPVLMEGTVAGTNSVWARAFFVIFIIAMRGFLLPVVAGSVAAAYGALWRARAAAEGRGRRPVGAVDWRKALAGGGVSWAGLALARNRQWDDALAEAAREQTLRAFPQMRAWEGGGGGGGGSEGGGGGARARVEAWVR
jgi:hypothetical protein